jgi:TP901 family phage tail tape measure protein
VADREAQLRLRLTAQNEANPAFTSLSEATDSLTKAINEAARAIQESFDSMMRGAQSLSEGMSRSLSEGERVIQGFNESAQSLPRTFNEAAESVSQAFREMSSSASQASQGVAQSFSEDERAVSSLDEAIRAQTTAIENNFRDLVSVVRESSEGIAQSIRDVERSSQQMAEATVNSTRVMRSSMNDAGLLIGLQQIGESMEHVGGLGEHLFTEAIKQSADFEQSMSNIKGVLVALGTPMQDANNLVEELKEKALDLGSHYHRSATEIGEAFDTLIRQGVSAKDVIDGAGQAAIQVSLVTKQDLGETANVISDIYNEFRDQFEHNAKSMQQNMQDVANATVGAMLKARISMTDFIDTMKYVGPQASMAGTSIQDLSAAIALLAEHGIKGSQAGTTLRRVYTNLIEPTKEGARALSELGIIQGKHNLLIDEATGKMKPFAEVQEILSEKFSKLSDVQKEAYAKMIFGQYALTGSLVLVNENADAFQKLRDSLAGVSAEQAAGVMMDNLAGDMMLLRANVETLAKSFGDTLHPIMRSITQAIDSLVQKFMALPPGVKEAIMVVLGVGSALAMIGGSIVSFIATLGFLKIGLEGFRNLNPFTTLIFGAKEASTAMKELAVAEAAMGAASGGGALAGLAGVFSRVGAGARQLGAAISALMLGPWKLLGAGITGAINVFRDFPGALSRVVAAIGSFATSALANFGKVFTILTKPLALANMGLYTALEAFIGWVPGVIQKIATLFTLDGAIAALTKAGTMIRTILTAMTGPWGALVLVIMAAVGAIIENWDKIRSWVQEHFGGTIPTTWNQLRSTAESVFNSIKSVITNVWEGIKNTTQAVWAYIGPTVIGAVEKISAYWKEIWPELKELFVEVWHAMEVVLAPILAAIGAAIVAALGFIKGAWGDAWNLIKTTLKTVWDAIVDVIRTGWDLISGLFKVALDILTGNWGKAWQDLKQTVSNVWNDIWRFLSDALHNAFQWGSNFVHMIADGISGAIGAVEDAAKNVVGRIKAFLGFSSPTKEGEGSTSHRWAPNFVQMFSDGLTEGTSRVADSSRKLAQTLADYLGFHSPTNQGPASDSDQWAPNFIDMLSKGLLDGVPKVKDAATQVAQAIKDAFTQLINDIQSSAQQLTDAVKSTADTMQTAFNDAFDAISKKADETLDHIKQQVAAMQQAVQNVSFSRTGGGGGDSGPVGLSGDALSAYNDAIAAGGVSLADGGFQSGDQADAAGLGGAAPAFASGGYVTKPTLALVGEAGPEYIIPEAFLKNQNGYTLGLPNGFGGAGAPITQNITININGVGKDGRQLGSDIVNVLRQQMNFAFR